MLAWLCFQHVICQGRHRHTLPIRLTWSRIFWPSCSNFSVSWSICPWKAMLTCQSTEVNKHQNMSRHLIQCEAVKGWVFSYSRFAYFLAILLPPLTTKLSVGAFRIKQRLQSHWIAWACQSFPSCSCTASVTWGWQCPRFVTPMPGSSVFDEGCQMTGTVHNTCRASRFQVHNLYCHKQFFRFLPLHLWWLVKSKLSKIQCPVPVEKSKYFSPSMVKTQLPSPRSSTSDPSNLSLTLWSIVSLIILIILNSCLLKIPFKSTRNCQSFLSCQQLSYEHLPGRQIGKTSDAGTNALCSPRGIRCSSWPQREVHKTNNIKI